VSGRPGLDSGQEKGIIIYFTASRQSLEFTQLLIQILPVVSSPGVMLPEPETDRSPPSSAEVMNVFMPLYLINQSKGQIFLCLYVYFAIFCAIP
jgi:hypothetical protein